VPCSLKNWTNARPTGRSSFPPMAFPKSVPAEAAARQMIYVDATCRSSPRSMSRPKRHHTDGREIVLIGHAGHPEVIGTMGQLPSGESPWSTTVADAERFVPKDPKNLAFVTQTTLSVDDTAEIVAVPAGPLPGDREPHKEDIRYATTNRQDAVKVLAPGAGLVLVIGARTSSNSVRLVEVALRAGAERAELVRQRRQYRTGRGSDNVTTLGPHRRGQRTGRPRPGVIDACRARFEVTLDTVETARESVTFKLPRILAD